MKLIGLTKSERQFVNDCMLSQKMHNKISGNSSDYFDEKFTAISMRIHGDKNIRTFGDGTWKLYPNETPSENGYYLVTCEMFDIRFVSLGEFNTSSNTFKNIHAKIIAWTELISPYR